MRKPTFSSMLYSIKALFTTVRQYILDDHIRMQELKKKHGVTEDYPYNTEFGSGRTHKEMQRIDEENKKQYEEDILGI
mgnify:CR=1 FL=1